MPDVIPNFIDGEWVIPASTDGLAIDNPATAEVIGVAPITPPKEIDRAVQTARKAFPGWRGTPPVERARVLFRLKMLLEEHIDDLARSLTTEHGKIVAESKGEIRRGIENVEHACGIPTLMQGDTLEDVASGIDCETIRQPLGVFAIITPYNFPVMIPLWFWPYAVATGNTVVLKPSEQDPLTHQLIVDLAVKAGLPSGVLNVVHGDHRVSDVLIDHPDIVGVSFVGSSKIGKHIYSRAAANGKRVQALGGAKNHLIVFPDADLDETTTAVLSSVFASAGQRCLAGSIVVGIGDAFAPMRERILDRASSLRLGDGHAVDTDIGPVVSARHAKRVHEYIETGAREGAKLSLDGRKPKVRSLPNGHFVGPTVFENVTPDMVIGREEIFGPVAGLSHERSLEEALALVHRTPYGNAISVFTTSGRIAREFRYHAGISMIGINVGVVAPMAFFPFGGSRGSFFGDLKAQGRDAVSFYTDNRVVISRW